MALWCIKRRFSDWGGNFDRNGWKLSNGISGNFVPLWVETFERNNQKGEKTGKILLKMTAFCMVAVTITKKNLVVFE